MPAPAKADYPWHPSTDRLVRSAMEHVPASQLIGVLMTGMGNDGAEAMAELHRGGGHTIAEAEETAVVWGMPGELVRADGATGWCRCRRSRHDCEPGAGSCRSSVNLPASRRRRLPMPPSVLGNLVSGQHGRALGGGARSSGHAGRSHGAGRRASQEGDPRVREAMFTSLARIATPEAADLVICVPALGRRESAHRRARRLAHHDREHARRCSRACWATPMPTCAC